MINLCHKGRWGMQPDWVGSHLAIHLYYYGRLVQTWERSASRLRIVTLLV